VDESAIMFVTKRSRLKFTESLSAVVMLAGALGCEASRPVAPSPVLTPPPFVEPSRPAIIYNEPPGANYYRVYCFVCGGLVSRYVLYQDSTFDLQFTSVQFGLGSTLGTYSRSDSLIELTFNDNPAWQGTAIVRGDTLRITYNYDAADAGWLDGAYLRAR
jgi:hypothetical protein